MPRKCVTDVASLALSSPTETCAGGWGLILRVWVHARPEFFERTSINISDHKHKNKVFMMSDVRGKTGYSVGWEQVVILNRVVSLNLIEKVLF